MTGGFGKASLYTCKGENDLTRARKAVGIEGRFSPVLACVTAQELASSWAF